MLASRKYIEAARYTPYTFRSTDIGVVLDLMVHDLDLAMSLAGSPVDSVLAIGTSVMGGHEDVAQARLQFASGCVANLSASRVSYKPVRQMQVWSRLSHASIDFATRTAVVAQPSAVLMERRFFGDQLSAQEKSHLKDHLFEELIPLQRFEANAVNALMEEQRDFVESIREDANRVFRDSKGATSWLWLSESWLRLRTTIGIELRWIPRKSRPFYKDRTGITPPRRRASKNARLEACTIFSRHRRGQLVKAHVVQVPVYIAGFQECGVISVTRKLAVVQKQDAIGGAQCGQPLTQND